jgi:hypothetical protein
MQVHSKQTTGQWRRGEGTAEGNSRFLTQQESLFGFAAE